MNTQPEQFLETAVFYLAPYTQEANHPAPNRLDVTLETAELLPAIQSLHCTHWGYLAAITGLDTGNQFEVLYHFCAGPVVVTLRVKVAKETAVLPSICPIIPSASFFERELLEMFGLTITNTPNTNHLFLPDEWPEGIYPLRKEFHAL